MSFHTIHIWLHRLKVICANPLRIGLPLRKNRKRVAFHVIQHNCSCFLPATRLPICQKLLEKETPRIHEAVAPRMQALNSWGTLQLKGTRLDVAMVQKHSKTHFKGKFLHSQSKSRYQYYMTTIWSPIMHTMKSMKLDRKYHGVPSCSTETANFKRTNVTPL